MDRLCLFCTHFFLDAGEPGYSEYTPGSNFTCGCYMRHWDIEEYDGTGTYNFFNFMRSAINCKDYEINEFAKSLGAPE